MQNNDEIPVGKAKNLIGQKFGELTVLYRTKNIGRSVAWKCQCSCGNVCVVRSDHLINKEIKNCGKCSIYNMIGKKFNLLTVLSIAPPDMGEKGCTSFICQCDCGNKKIVSGYHLKRGDIKSCGCLKTPNLIGQRFGKLTVIEKSYIGKDKAQYWKCQCDCGNITYVNTANLKRHHTESCGCFGQEQRAKANRIDLTNQRFGKLIALLPTDKRNNEDSVIWKCKCDCGNICYASANQLNAHRVYSCGCSKRSHGEQDIINLLNEKQIYFTEQQSFDTCVFLDTKRKAKFDFFINNKYLIEFDGEQHYRDVDFFGGKEQFKIQQNHDNYKNQWCKENNIPLIRIPYTKLDTLCLEDLMLETTQFRVV